jgi:hypothetical protein
MGKKEIVIGIYKAPFTLNKENMGVSFFSILVHRAPYALAHGISVIIYS